MCDIKQVTSLCGPQSPHLQMGGGCIRHVGSVHGIPLRGLRGGQDGVLSQGANEDNSAFTCFIYWVCVEDFV